MISREAQPEGLTRRAAVLYSWLTPDRWPRWLVYVFAVVSVAAIFLIRWRIEETFGERPLLILFVLPILLSAYLGGLGPGLVATLVAFIGANLLLIPPLYSFAIDKSADLYQVIALILTGALISVLNEALHRSRRHVETARLLQAVTLASIGDAVITTDNGGHITFLNFEAERLTGWSQAEALNQPLSAVLRIINEQTRQTMEDPVTKVLASGNVMGLANHTLLLARNGREIAIDDSAAPIKHPDGAVLGVVLVFRDCTAKRQAEAKLRESEEYYRSLFDNMLNGLVYGKMLFDHGEPVDFIHLSVNKSFETLTGLPDVVGKKASEVIPGLRQANPEFFTIHGRVATTGQPESFEMFVHGLEKWVSATVYSPQKEYFIAVFDDVTERKRAEETLEASRSKLQAALASMTDAVFISDTAGRYIDFNEAFATFHKFKNKDECGQSFSEAATILDVFLPDGTLAPLEQWAVPRALRGENGTNAEYTLQRKDTGETWVGSYNFAPMRDKDGVIIGAVIVARDITQRKRAEEALRHSLAEKTSLLKEVHHRVKNNLQIVASLLSLQANRASQPEVVEVLEDTRKRVHSMALLHEALYQSDNLARINFAAYVEQLCRHLQRSVGVTTRQITVANQVASFGLPLEQAIPCGLIINELVSNALKHAFPDHRAGKVTVALGPAPERRLVLRVTDNGVGPPPVMDLVTAPTLGLRLVSGLASQLGGQLTVEQPDGVGLAFQVIFPAPEDPMFEDQV
jgi:PAS domain S-box-containing protein